MPIKDYKGKRTYDTLGLKRGKAAIKQDTSSKTSPRIVLWIGLLCMVIFVNYLFFVRLSPINKQEKPVPPKPREHIKLDGFTDWFDRAYQSYQEGDLRKAIDEYTQAIEFEPEDIRCYFNRGIIYSKMELHDKAINDYNKVISLNPDYAEAYNNRGWSFFQKSLFDRAIQDCNRALLLDPNMATAYHTRGMAYKHKGFPEKAKDDFQQSCRLGDSNGCDAYDEIVKPSNDKK